MIGGGFKAIQSVLRYSAQIGPVKLLKTLRSKNACKACAFGTGGQNGGLHNESKRGIEVCNKNIQAHLSDIRKTIPATYFKKHSIAQLQQLSGKQLEDLGRLGTPLYKQAGDKHYQPISYKKALDITATRFRTTHPQESFFYASGRSSNEAVFALQLLARLYGSNNVNNCSYYCHQASGVALNSTIGTGTATIQYQDLKLADTIFVLGANPASNHPRFVKTLFECRRRGGQVVVVNPAKEPGLIRFAAPSDLRSMLKGGEEVASLYIQPHLGGDIAFMQGVSKWVLEQDHADQAFIDKHCEGFDAFAAAISDLSWEKITEHSGVSRTDISKAAQIYSESKCAVFAWSMGLTHHLHGVANIETLATLALIRGMIGRPGAGLLPLRGHSNIQGTGSMGFTPALKEAMQTRIEKKLDLTLPTTSGLDTMACMHASANGQMKAALMLGGNLLASNPNTPFATNALNNIPFKCYISSTLNMSHVNGVDQEALVLPIRVRDEEKQATTQESMFNFVRMSDGGINRFDHLMSEIEIICTLGKKIVNPDLFDFSEFFEHRNIRKFVAEVNPGFNKLDTIDTDKDEFHIEGRTLHTPTFNTQNGKAQLKYHIAPERSATYLLTTVRSEGQFNSIIYHEHDTYRGQSGRWVVMMNPADMKREGLEENELIDLKTSTGEMKRVSVKPFDIRPGNIMTYYPEANILIPHATDSASKTPGFKSVDVQIIKNSST